MALLTLFRRSGSIAHKETNPTTVESKEYERISLVLSEGRKSLSKTKLLCKKSPKTISKILTASKHKNYTPGKLSRHINNLKRNVKVSRKIISLIEDEDGLSEDLKLNKTTVRVTRPIRHSSNTKLSPHTSLIDSKLQISINCNKPSGVTHRPFDGDEENMVESPIPRPRAPIMNQYRKSDEKSARAGEFHITPTFTEYSNRYQHN